ncbi:NUDIX hydrolase [Bacillus sp. JJ722]|uniref:NUDIX hydrolase n=1 Tax=Bacillus sp. JJ722 TaxID=3122973 RepID=UPI002FFE75A7
MDVVYKTDEAVFNFRVAGIWIENGHVLIHKDVKDDHWLLPGGRVQLSEETQAGIEREFREELGVDVTIERLVWISENFFEYTEKNFHEIGFYYKVTSNQTSLLFTEEPFYGVEGERFIFQWAPIEKLKEIKFYPEFLKTALNNLPSNTQHFIEK